MAEKIKLVRGDTGPQIKVVVTDQFSVPVDISGATVRLRFRASGSAPLLATLLGTLVAGLENADGSITSTAPYNIAGVGGRVVFSWGANDLLVPAGAYEGEIETTFAGGTVQTVYDLLKFSVREQF